MKGRNGLKGAAGVEPGLGRRRLSQAPWDLFVTRSPGRGVPPLTCILPEVGICCTCLATAGLVSSFVQQIFTELLNPRAGLATTSLPFSEPQFYSSERREDHPCLSRVTRLVKDLLNQPVGKHHKTDSSGLSWWTLCQHPGVSRV